jgi:predicted AlkP superfamily phosphohydrolase/phosphomutase
MLDRVIRGSDMPPGAHAEEGADLHLVLDGYRHISCPLFANDGHVISKQIRGDSGSHRMQGMFVARGPHVRKGTEVTGARIVDLAPTTLHVMGCPVPEDMDGRVLTGILDAALLDARAPQVGPADSLGSREAYALSEDEESELEARLKGLGYLG